MGDEEGFVERGSDFGRVEGFVKDVAIEAPVAAKDEKNALVRSGGGAEGGGDFLVGVDVGGIDLLVFEGLTETRGGGVLCADDVPLAVLPEPGLRYGDELFFQGRTLFRCQGELEDKGAHVRPLIRLLDDLRTETGETLGFPAGPESDFIRKRHGLFARAKQLWRGRLGVQSGEGGGIASQDGGAPLFKGGKGDGGSGLVGKCGVRQQEK